MENCNNKLIKKKTMTQETFKEAKNLVNQITSNANKLDELKDYRAKHADKNLTKQDIDEILNLAYNAIDFKIQHYENLFLEL